MKSKKILCQVVTLATLFYLLSGLAGAKAVQTDPVLNNGKKWRIAYLEGGPFVNYQGSLKSTIQSLISMGWMEKRNIPESSDIEDTRTLWEWLSIGDHSRYLEFVRDAYWSSAWDRNSRVRNAAQIRHRVNTSRDIDLFIAMGTWAGQDLASIADERPVIVMSCSDPVKAGIVAGADDSGKDNVHAWCDPTRIERRLKLFHDIFGFKRLGVVYENSEDGKLFANLPSIRKVSQDRGFAVIACEAPDTGRTLEECRSSTEKCMDKLAAQIDAFTVSDHRGLHPEHFPAIIEPFVKKRIPAFTVVSGPALVKRGVLMGIAREDYLPLGGFYARTIAAVLNGSKPRDLPQIYQEPMKLAINLEAARRIGYEIPANVKKVADILFDTINDSGLK